MLKKNLLVAALVASFAAPAMAEEASPFSANVSITTNYLYRGLSQTGNKPALQGGFDYAHESGFYAGVWGSSISWLSDGSTANNAGTEFDTYLGYSAEAGDIGYDVGFLRYNYPGTYNAGKLTANTNELYGSVSYKFVKAKYSRSSGNLFGASNSSGSGYLDLSASYDLESGVSVGAHYGKQTVANNSASSYKDYNFSVSKEIGGYGFSVMYSKTDLTSIDSQGNDLGKGTLVFAISRSL